MVVQGGLQRNGELSGWSLEVDLGFKHVQSLFPSRISVQSPRAVLISSMFLKKLLVTVPVSVEIPRRKT